MLLNRNRKTRVTRIHQSTDSGDLGAGLIADKTHISPVTCIFARVRTQLAIPISRRSLMEHRITVRNRWKSASTPSAVPSLSLTRLFDSNYFPSTADCRAATSPNFRKPRVSLFFLLSRTVRGLPAPLVLLSLRFIPFFSYRQIFLNRFKNFPKI